MVNIAQFKSSVFNRSALLAQTVQRPTTVEVMVYVRPVMDPLKSVSQASSVEVMENVKKMLQLQQQKMHKMTAALQGNL